MKYYIYQLIDPRSDTVFYVGKGQGSRMYKHIKDFQCGQVSNKHLYCKIRKILDVGLEIEYKQIFFTDDEQEAYDFEVKIIAKIGLRNLCNLTVGGEGGTPSGETCRKLSISSKKTGFKRGHVPWMKGRTHSIETRKKLAGVQKGKIHSEGTRYKLSISGKKYGFQKGHKHSTEIKCKISESLKKRYYGKAYSIV